MRPVPGTPGHQAASPTFAWGQSQRNERKRSARDYLNRNGVYLPIPEVRQSKRTNPPFEQIEIINGSMQADLRLGCQTIPCCVLEAEFSE